MQAVADQFERGDGVPQLVDGWELGRTTLSPAEAFLLSRIDGRTPWPQLRQMGGLPPRDADACLARWLSEGRVVLAGRSARVRAGGASEPLPIDPTLDLAPELQREILEFEAGLGRSYFALLGVGRDADAAEIKRAYFRLSKIFHPDRYFRRQIGDFGGRLDRIFRKLVEAYELLSDPNTRKEIERNLPEPEPEPEPERSAPEPPSVQPVAPPAKLTKRQTLERLRRHFKMPERVMADRRSKARQLYESAMIAAQRGRWSEAAPSVRLAIAFDPWNDEYRSRFGEIQANGHQQRLDKLFEQNPDGLDSAAGHEAFRLIEDIVAFRPADAGANQRAAELALSIGEAKKALEFAQTAVDLEPESVDCLLTLGRALRRNGLREKAVATLNEARRLDPRNSGIRDELKDLRRARRKS